MEALAEEGKIGTIIVKDLSRFGREQTEMGRLTQEIYRCMVNNAYSTGSYKVH